MTVPTAKVVPCPTGFSDHIFKEEDGVQLPLRIWPAPKSAEGKRPWLIWIHGGGWVAGKHVIPNAWVLPAFEQLGYHVVSVAYRYLPEVSMMDLVQDCEDSYLWCLKHLPSIVGEDRINIDWSVVGGDSAGGHLSTLAGATWNPPPKVVIDVFGVVDMTGFNKKKHTGDPEPALPKFIEERDVKELERLLQSRDPKKAEYICPWDWELPPEMDTETLQSFWGMPDFTPSPKDSLRMDMSKMMRANRFTIAFRWELPEEKEKTSEAEYEALLRKHSPYYLAEDAKKFPPTFFLHGTGDSAVPVEQSYQFAKLLRGMNVPVGEAYAPGGEHCFDNQIHGPEYQGWKEYIVPCMEFIDQHIRA